MTLTQEDLLSISNLLDAKFQAGLQTELRPVNDSIRDLRFYIHSELELIKNDIRNLYAELRIVKDDVNNLRSELQAVKDDVNHLRSELQAVKDDVNDLRSELQAVKDDINDLRSELQAVKDDVNDLRSELQAVKDDIRTLRDEVNGLNYRVTKLEVHIENVTDKNIQLLAENYVPAAKRYEKASAQIDAMRVDIEIIKGAIEHHSEALHKLA